MCWNQWESCGPSRGEYAFPEEGSYWAVQRLNINDPNILEFVPLPTRLHLSILQPPGRISDGVSSSKTADLPQSMMSSVIIDNALSMITDVLFMEQALVCLNHLWWDIAPRSGFLLQGRTFSPRRVKILQSAPTGPSVYWTVKE